MCNWLVNMALYQAGASKTFAGKFLGVMMPISAFVTMSFDHAVANMALIPIGMAAGADISVGKLFVKNLIPATLGNIIGGCTLVTLVIGLAYDRIPGVVLADLFSLRRSPQKSTTQQLAQRRSSIKGAGGGP